ncbi:MAG TPA: VOC family protein [Mycobacteriales bacterium]|nr:VOC family protein [Mycobacteriales bacterium]
MEARDQYHAGIVVDDFEAALVWFSAVAGYRWCEPVAVDVPVDLPDGRRTLPMRLTYSVDEPRLELVQGIPGTLWIPSTSGIHHLGYWSDDVDADIAHLQAQGMALEASAPLPDGTKQWAYCKGPGTVRIELVNRVLEPALRAWFTTPAQ